MSTDVTDWQEATEEEKAVIGGILRGFTQLELHVACYWGDVVTKYFPKHEIHAMARAFSCSEAVHAAAYSHLSDTLGLDEFEAFLGDPTARAKIDYFVNTVDPIVSLGVFSGAGEGVSLFSSFAALLSFNLDGRFKGLSQIISWSALDEQQHSDGGCALFRHLDNEGLSATIKSDRSWKDLRQSSQMKTTSSNGSLTVTRYLALIVTTFGTIFAIALMIG